MTVMIMTMIGPGVGDAIVGTSVEIDGLVITDYHYTPDDG